MTTMWRVGVLLALIFPIALLVGCGKGTPNTEGSKTTPAEKNKDDGWWCAEHGMPEDECAQCNSKLAAEYKKKGDWCKEHDRPESQCFICHPELKEKFAAQYRAKYGKEPPPMQDEGHEKKTDKK